MKRNIVLICLDTARKDLFDEYATRIQHRAEVVFDQTRAASCWSVPSHASMFTGKLPSKHGIHSHNPTFTELDKSKTVISDLDEYTSIGVSANAYARSDFGFDKLFDEFEDINRRSLYNDALNVSNWYSNVDNDNYLKYVTFLKDVLQNKHILKSLANGVANQVHHTLPKIGYPALFDDGANQIIKSTIPLIQESDEPLFIFTNFMETHSPRYPRQGYNNSIHGLPADWTEDVDVWELNNSENLEFVESELEETRKIAAAEIDYVDRKVCQYIDLIRDLTSRETTFIITADHGENLGYPNEDYLFKHTSSLSEALLHVPFVLINPPKGYDSVEKRLFSHTELRELIVGLSDNRTPDLFRDVISAEVIGICSSHRNKLSGDQLDYWDRMIRCGYRHGEKIEWDTSKNLRKFEIDTKNPSSQTEVEINGEVPQWASEMYDVDIHEYKESAELNDNVEKIENGMTDETMSRLNSLGYI